MRRYIITGFTILICLFAISSRGQYISVDHPQYKIVKLDTINITGVVYNYDGKPVEHARIISKNNMIGYQGYPIYSMTDNAGKFRLDGALINDTLTVDYLNRTTIPLKGSRYIEIHLMPPKYDSHGDTINISAGQVIKRKTPSFKVLTNARIVDYFGLSFSSDPSFLSGRDKFVKLVNKQIVYPQQAINKNIEGQVEIAFTIGRDGIPSNFRTIRGIGYGCEEAVVNAIKKSPKWQPGLINGYPFSKETSIVVNFKLTDKK